MVNETYVKVVVDTDTAYEIDPETYEAIITVDYEDAPVVGELTVEKKGEVLDSYKLVFSQTPMKNHLCIEKEALQVPSMRSMQLRISLQLICRKTLDRNRTKYYSEGELVAAHVPEMMEKQFLRIFIRKIQGCGSRSSLRICSESGCTVCNICLCG